MIPQRLSLITLGVSDMAAARAFYERLGWQAHAHSNDEVTFFQMNGAVLGLYGLGPLAEDQGRAGTTLGTGAATLAINFATEREVDAAFDQAIEAGGTAMKQPEKAFWGGYSGYWSDPDGHVWEFAMNPFWTIDDDGGTRIP